MTRQPGTVARGFRGRLWLVAASAVLALLLGCPKSTPGPRAPEPSQPPPAAPGTPPEAKESAPEEGGEGTFALEDPFTAVSGARIFTSSDRILRGLAFHGLTTVGPGGRVEGELAEKWQSLRGGAEWVFHLRPDTAFSNGRYVEARHVVASWEKLILQPESLYAWLLEPLKGFDEARAGQTPHVEGLVLEEGLTLRVILKRPVPNFAARLAHPALGISAFGEDEAGVGPYEIWGAPKATLIVVRSNPEYFRGLPHLDEIGFVRGEAAAPSHLAAGQLDAAVLAPGDKPAVTSTTKIFGHAAGRTYLLGLNRSSAAFSSSDAAARFLASLDREAIRVAAGGEAARIPEGLLDTGGKNRQHSTPQAGKAPAATWSNRFNLLLMDSDPVAAAIAGQLGGGSPKGGGKALPHPVRATDFPSSLLRREFDAFLLPEVRFSEDPLIELESLAHLNGSIPDTLMARLRDLQGEADPARLSEGISELEGRLIAEGYLVPLVTAPRRLLVTKGICGLRGDPMGMLDWTHLWRSRSHSGDCD